MNHDQILLLHSFHFSLAFTQTFYSAWPIDDTQSLSSKKKSEVVSEKMSLIKGKPNATKSIIKVNRNRKII